MCHEAACSLSESFLQGVLRGCYGSVTGVGESYRGPQEPPSALEPTLRLAKQSSYTENVSALLNTSLHIGTCRASLENDGYYSAYSTLKLRALYSMEMNSTLIRIRGRLPKLI